MVERRRAAAAAAALEKREEEADESSDMISADESRGALEPEPEPEPEPLALWGLRGADDELPGETRSA